MAKKMRIMVTAVYESDVNLESYPGVETPEEAAVMEKQLIETGNEEDYDFLWFDADRKDVKVEIVDV